MLQREESRHDFAFIAGVIIGAAAGAVATLALAPAAGSDTRDKVRQRVSTLDVETAKQRAASVGDAAKQRAASVSSSARDAAQRGKDKVTELAAMRGDSSSDEWLDEASEVAEAVESTGDTLVEETVSEVSAAVPEPASDDEKQGPA